MGNILGKPDYRGLYVDGGLAQVKERNRPTQERGGGVAQTTATSNGTAARPQRIDPNEYDPVLVGKLIKGKKLSPFYDGEFDEKGEGRSVTSAKRSINGDRGSIRTADGRAKAKVKAKPPKKPSKKQSAPSAVDKSWLTSQLAECPICLLWYPRNINYTKCCKKPICTLCFVSMKRPNSPTKTICCPFCRHTNLTAVYRPPEKILKNGSFGSGVVCEQIRPPRLIARPQIGTYYRYNAVGGPNAGGPTFAAPRANAGSSRPFTFYSPASVQRLDSRFPAGRQQQQLSRPSGYPPATAAQVAAAGLRTQGGTGLQLSPEEVRAYEERALGRAIRLSMLEY